MTPSHPTPGRTARLRFEQLEDRAVPAVTFQFDYSLDAAGFFNDPARRAALERAAADLAAPITSTPSGIAPGGANSWQAVFNNPATGAEVRLPNVTVPAGTILVFAGARDLAGGEAGEGGPGGYWVSGADTFLATVGTRGMPGFGPWGGSLTLDTTQNWYFGADPNALPAGQLDFQSVATHELGHLLGFGTAPQFKALIAGGRFTGATATIVAGSAPLLSPDQSHFAQGTRSGADPVAMQPTLEAHQRTAYTTLDYAVLTDLGWQLAAPSSPPPTPTVEPPPPSAGLDPGEQVVVVSGPTDGSVRLFTSGPGGQLSPHGEVFRPFGDFGGAVRSAVADVNGDGTADLVFGTGPGGGSRVRVLDGLAMTDLAAEFSAFEPAFSGGVFLAAADFDRDGRAEVVVTPDQGGGARVRVFGVAGGAAQVKADFFGIDDPTFRGGARPAAGDVTGDGVADLVVAAGFGGGPRVSVLDGATVLGGRPAAAVPDFFAFEPALRNGVYVTVGDADGDGRGDLTFGAGPGGAPRVMTLSGRVLTGAGVDAALANPLANGFAGRTDDRSGVRVAARDLDGDGSAELVTGSGAADEVRVYVPAGGGLIVSAALNPFGPAALDGVYVG